MALPSYPSAKPDGFRMASLGLLGSALAKGESESKAQEGKGPPEELLCVVRTSNNQRLQLRCVHKHC